jgi:hypothetical protein
MVMHESSQDPAGPASAGGAQSDQPRRVRRGRRAYLLIVVAVLLAVVAVTATRHHREVTVTHPLFSTAGGRLGDVTVEPFLATFASDSPVTVTFAVRNTTPRPARYVILLRLQSVDGLVLIDAQRVEIPRLDSSQVQFQSVSFVPLSSVATGPVDLALRADVTREAA